MKPIQKRKVPTATTTTQIVQVANLTVRKSGKTIHEKAKTTNKISDEKTINKTLFEDVPFEINFAKGELYVNTSKSVNSATLEIFVKGESFDTVTLKGGQFYQVSSLAGKPAIKIKQATFNRHNLQLKAEPKAKTPHKLVVAHSLKSKQSSQSFILGGAVHHAKTAELVKTSVYTKNNQFLGYRVDSRMKLEKGTRPTQNHLIIAANLAEDFGAVCCAECRLNKLSAAKSGKKPCPTCPKKK